MREKKTAKEALDDLREAFADLFLEVAAAIHLEEVLDWLEKGAWVYAFAFWLGFVGLIFWLAWVWR